MYFCTMNGEISSNSGFLIPAEDSSLAQFTDFVELPCKGFNVIFKAKKYGKWHILKGLKPELRNQTVYRELLRKEFTIGVELNHANIANVMSFEENEQMGPYIVMEYVDGVTLSDFLKEKQPRNLYLKLLDELLSAMIYFHSKQIIHRDLKPSNIMVTHNGHNIKVIDFGLADADSYAYLKQPAGTLSYAAPEQLQDGAPIDARTDIYAFGKILELNFPLRFRWLARKCAKHFPEWRPENTKSIVKLIRRRKLIHWISISCIVILFLSFMLIWIQPQLFNATSSSHTQAETILTDNTDTDVEETSSAPSSNAKHTTTKYSAEYQKNAKQLDESMAEFYRPLITKLEKRQFQWVEESEYELYSDGGAYNIRKAQAQVWQPINKTVTDEDLSLELWLRFDSLWKKYFDKITALQRMTPRYSDAKKEIDLMHSRHQISQEEYERKIDSLGPVPKNILGL